MNDKIQYCRLISEIFATGFTKEQVRMITESMDLTWGEIEDIYRCAEIEWEEAKDEVFNEETSGIYYPMFLSWCKSYEEEEQELRKLIECKPADVKLLKEEYLQLTGKNYRRKRTNNALQNRK
jgi:hypothetical protein